MSAPITPRFSADPDPSTAQPLGSPEVSKNLPADPKNLSDRPGCSIEGAAIPLGGAVVRDPREQIIANLQRALLSLIEMDAKFIPHNERLKRIGAANKALIESVDHGFCSWGDQPW